MPNKEGGYGGYRQSPQRGARKVRAPGAEGGVRRGVTPPPVDPPRRSRQTPHTPHPSHPPYAEPRRTGSRPAEAPDHLEEGWLSPQELAGRSPRSAPPPHAPDPRRARQRSARRRARRRFVLLCTAAGILVVSAVITLLLPSSVTTPPSAQATGESAALATRMVAPLPYAGGSSGEAQAVDWGTVGPQRQDDARTYTALPTSDALVPECGRVTTEWFADAAFLGDSLTVGYLDYDINLGGAQVLAYEGVSPNTFVNRTVVTNADGEEEVPFDRLAEMQPAKLYVMVGTNALVGGTNDEGFLAYYGQMLDELKAILPNTQLYIQSVLPARPEALESAPGLSADHLATINAAIRELCNEKGCLYLDVASALADDAGALQSDYAQPDGIHLTVAGYNAWVSYLCTHVPYDRDNPYQAGSTYYLDDSVKSLLQDLP